MPVNLQTDCRTLERFALRLCDGVGKLLIFFIAGPTVAGVLTGTKEGSMSSERWTSARWEQLLSSIFRVDHVSFFPHKIFRWDRNGVYRDCYFPVSCEHLLGGEKLIGRSIKEVLKNDSAKSLTKALSRTLKTQSPQNVQVVFPTMEKTIVAVVRLFPYQSGALGFITDHDLEGRPVLSVSPRDPSLAFLQKPSTF